MLPALGIRDVNWFWIIPAYYLAVMTHEMGHAIAGRLVGFRILAFGIGYGRPIVKFRVFGTVLYFGIDAITGGLALPLWQGFRPKPSASFFFILCGPLTNALGAAVALGCWHYGLQNSFVLLFFYISLFVFLITAVPSRVRRPSGFAISSDGLQLWGIIKGTRHVHSVATQELGSVLHVRKLCKDLGSIEGEIHYTQLAAYLFQAFGDQEGFQEMLADPCLANPKRGTNGKHWEMLTNGVQQLKDSPTVASTVEPPDYLSDRDRTFFCTVLAITRTNILLQQDLDAKDAAAYAQELAKRAGHLDLITITEVNSILANPPNDLNLVLIKILSRTGRDGLNLVDKHRVCGIGARILAEQNRIEEARPLFQLASILIQQASRFIVVERTKKAFLEAASKPLLKAQSYQSSGLPMFLFETQTIAVRGTIAVAWAFACAVINASVGFAMRDNARFDLLTWTAAVAFLATLGISGCLIGLGQLRSIRAAQEVFRLSRIRFLLALCINVVLLTICLLTINRVKSSRREFLQHSYRESVRHVAPSISAVNLTRSFTEESAFPVNPAFERAPLLCADRRITAADDVSCVGKGTKT